MAAVRSLLPRDERRAQILRAAGATFAVEGYVATSVDDVAKAAGITKLIVYRHFESKADLYRAILEETSERLVEEWVADFGDGAESKPAVATLLRVARELPDGFRLLFVHAAREADFVEFAADFRRLLLEVYPLDLSWTHWRLPPGLAVRPDGRLTRGRGARVARGGSSLR